MSLVRPDSKIPGFPMHNTKASFQGQNDIASLIFMPKMRQITVLLLIIYMTTELLIIRVLKLKVDINSNDWGNCVSGWEKRLQVKKKQKKRVIICSLGID